MLSVDLRTYSEKDRKCSFKELGEHFILQDAALLRDLCVISFTARPKDDVSLLWFISFSKYALFAARTRFVTLFLCFFIVFKLLFLFEFVTSFHCFNNIGGQPLGECRVFNCLPPKWRVFFYDRKKGLIPG